MTRLSNRQYPMLKVFATAKHDGLQWASPRQTRTIHQVVA